MYLWFAKNLNLLSENSLLLLVFDFSEIWSNESCHCQNNNSSLNLLSNWSNTFTFPTFYCNESCQKILTIWLIKIDYNCKITIFNFSDIFIQRNWSEKFIYDNLKQWIGNIKRIHSFYFSDILNLMQRNLPEYSFLVFGHFDASRVARIYSFIFNFSEIFKQRVRQIIPWFYKFSKETKVVRIIVLWFCWDFDATKDFRIITLVFTKFKMQRKLSENCVCDFSDILM